ncbi:BET1-like protein isoform X1 [Pan paniscus]|nr:BET1-like protein isoform X1 [Pan paniscus]
MPIASAPGSSPTLGPKPEVSEPEAEGAGPSRGVVGAEAGPSLAGGGAGSPFPATAPRLRRLWPRRCPRRGAGAGHDGGLGSGPSLFSAQSPGAVEEILDRENKRMADSLASKVTRLKSLALDIDRDAEDQNRYLDGMDSDFTSVTSLLTGSVKRFSTMARSGRDNRKLLCGMAVGLIVAFFILSYFLSRART